MSAGLPMPIALMVMALSASVLMPPSPRWVLAATGDMQRARRVLCCLRGVK